ncbi:MAG: hypothetical protein HYW07_23350 [Candidatus Latescibacteria bacterium]|nr:hypothetical protein [Candidatus Latescibacterota bacterium]
MSGEWTQWRGDKQRRGRAGVVGRMARPRIDWKHFVGCREDWIAIRPGSGGRFELPVGEVEADLEAVSRQYGLARYLDVDGSGNAVKVAESSGCRFHPLLPDTPGWWWRTWTGMASPRSWRPAAMGTCTV